MFDEKTIKEAQQKEELYRNRINALAEQINTLKSEYDELIRTRELLLSVITLSQDTKRSRG